MRKNLVMFLSVIFLFVLNLTAVAQTPLPGNFGAKGALQDSSITLGEALTYALQDEYLAQAKYDAVLQKFGNVRTFSNIKQAEQRHIAALLPLFEKYNIEVPANTASQYVSPPSTLKEAFQQGVDGEVDNIAMYEKLQSIPNLPTDVKNVFRNLGEASKNHLQAFRRGLGRQ